jgi:hypothetical protein
MVEELAKMIAQDPSVSPTEPRDIQLRSKIATRGDYAPWIFYREPTVLFRPGMRRFSATRFHQGNSMAATSIFGVHLNDSSLNQI